MNTYLLSIQVDGVSIYTMNHVLYKTSECVDFIQLILALELFCRFPLCLQPHLALCINKLRQ